MHVDFKNMFQHKEKLSFLKNKNSSNQLYFCSQFETFKSFAV